MLALFEQPQKLINWANDAIVKAHTAIDAYLTPENLPMVVETDRHTGRHVRKIVQKNPVPDIAERHLTDALNNTRNSFDQSLFAACKAIGKPLRDGHFPWVQNPDPDLVRRFIRKGTQIELIPKEFWSTIEAHQPYPTGEGYAGGDDCIRIMSQLANTKHTIGLEMGCNVGGVFAPGFHGGYVEYLEELIPVWDAVKKEVVLVRWKADVQFGKEYTVNFHVRFNAPEPVGSLYAVIAAKMFASKAQAVLNSLKARCVELGVT